MDFSDWTDARLLGERELIRDNLESIYQGIMNSISPLPDEEAERYNGLSEELSAIENELEERGYHLSPDTDEFEAPESEN